MGLNPATDNVSPHFHIVFDDGFYTVTFMKEGTKPKRITDLEQHSSQRYALENMDLRDTWFTPYLD